MSEKQEMAGESESMSDRIWRRLVSIIPFLLLSSLIAFLLFKYLVERNSSETSIFIIGSIIVFLIPVIAGAFKKDRQVGNTLAVLMPFVFLIEYMVQFEIGPFFLFLYISFMLGFVAAFPNYFAVNFILGLILPPSINTNSIKGVDECIQISKQMSFDEVEKLIDHALSYLIFYPIKTTSENEKQWELSKYYRHHYYLCARANNDKSVDLAFLFFTEGDEKLHQPKREDDLKFVKSAIEGCLNSKNIEYKRIQNPSFQSFIDRVLEKYKRAPVGERLKDARKTLIAALKSYKYVMILLFFIIVIIYRLIPNIVRLCQQHPLLSSIISVAIAAEIVLLLQFFGKNILQFLKMGDKK
jgi:hypothetical protein